jgi:hypothetical protein
VVPAENPEKDFIHLLCLPRRKTVAVALLQHVLLAVALLKL